MQLVFRFFVGGFIVLVFAELGEALTPKSFAGLFGAAPSVALATLMLTIFADGKQYAAIESRSMIMGAIAFFVYAFLSCQQMMRWRIKGAYAAIYTLVIWFVVSFGLWAVIVK